MDAMGQFVKKLFELSWSFLIPCFVMTSVITFYPYLRETLGIEEVYRKYQYLFSLLLIYSVICILFRLTDATILKFRRFLKRRKYKKNIVKELPLLTIEEKRMLAYILHAKSSAVWVPYHDPSVQTLLAKRIIYLVSKQIIMPGTSSKLVPLYSDWEYESCALVSVPRYVMELVPLIFA